MTDQFIMGKRFKTVLIAAGTISAVIIVLLIATNRQSRDTAIIIGSKHPVTQEDYWNSLNTKDRFDSTGAADCFRDVVANNHTLDFFNFLQGNFKELVYSDHMKAVRTYLHDTIRPPEKAEEMYELYGRYTEYQKEIYLDQKRWAASGSPEVMLENLKKIQEMRRQRFGHDTADSIFGVEVKSNEYALRKQIVIGDTALRGREKEERLAALRREMWGEQADTVDGRQSPVDRYGEKLKIHQADLASMDEQDRARKISEIRREIFTPEEAGRMDDADRQLKLTRKRDSEYSRLSRAILDDNKLSEQEKNRQIRELHNSLYGGPGK